MKKILLLFITLITFQNHKGQSALTLTITSNTGAFSLTCSNPNITLLPSTSYTASFVTYTLNAATYTSIGSSFNITSPGTYSITAFVSNSLNTTQTIVVGTNTTAPTSTLSPVFQNITCTNSAITSVTASGNPTTSVSHQFFSSLGGLFVSNTPTVNFVPTVGTYTNVFTNLINGCSVSKTFTVSGSGFPTFSVTSPQNFSLGCGTSSVLTVLITNAFTNPAGGTLSYTINPPGSGSYSTGPTFSFSSISVPGTWTVIVKDQVSGCETKVPISIVQNTVSPNSNVVVPSQILNCSIAQTTLQGNSTTQNVTYTWSIASPPSTSVGSNLTVNTTGNTTSSVIANYTLSIKDNNNQCFSSTVVPMYQNIFPPNALISNGAANFITSCTNPSIMLSNQSTTGIPLNSGFSSSLAVTGFAWNGPAPQTAASNTSTYVASVPGIYTLTAKDLNNGCTSSTTAVVSDHRIFPTITNPTPFCLDPPTTTIGISTILTGTTGGYTYFWSAPPAASAPSVTSPTLTTNSVGVYTVSVTDPSNGCTSIGHVTVTVCTGIVGTSRLKTSVSIFPNPSAGLFTLSANGFGKNVQVKIYNLLGALIKEQNLNSETNEINIEKEARGIYMMYLIENNMPVQNFKVIKE